MTARLRFHLLCAVNKLVRDVFLEAAGASAERSVQDYLRSQRVTSLGDLQYLQLDWLCSALQPLGIPALLLNKLLAQAKQRIAHASVSGASVQM